MSTFRMQLGCRLERNMLQAFGWRIALCVVMLLSMRSVPLYSQSDSCSLTLFLRDSVSGENIIGASVAAYSDSAMTKLVRGAVSNKQGFAVLPKLPCSTLFLRVRSLGYTELRRKVSVVTTQRLSLFMLSQSVMTSEVEVSAERQQFQSTSTISTITVNSAAAKSLPALLGESDVFRVVQMLPGVKSPSELSSGLYVRGGSPDQNLILLDGVIVYNTSHLGGFLSTFNGDALRDMKLIKGAFPAEYGGRLSSVLDITMKDGSQEKIQGQGALSIISSRITVEGPITKDLTFMVSGRRMYLDLLLGLVVSAEDEDEVPNYYFYDLNAKLTWRAGENDKYILGGFFGRDVIASPSKTDFGFDIHWGNTTGSLRWIHTLNSNAQIHSTLFYTSYNFSTELFDKSPGNTTKPFYSRSQIRDLGLKSELQWYGMADHSVKIGFEFTQHNFASVVTDSFSVDGLIPTNMDINAIDASLYLQDEWSFADAWRSNLGVRLYHFQSGSYTRAEPRLQLAYLLNDEQKITASAALAHQFLHLVVRNDINLPTDLWFPSTKNILPERSSQFVLGYEQLFGENKEFSLQIEAYYKYMQNLVEYKDSASFSLFQPLETQFTTGTGKAYGVELLLQKKVGKWSGWFGYCLSWTTRNFAELNRGREFSARYDRRHDVNLCLNYRILEDFDLGVVFTLGSGFAYTMPTGNYAFSPFVRSQFSWMNSQYAYTDRNAYRLPMYHRMDISLNYHCRVFGLASVVNVSIYNVYNHLNPFAQYIDYEYVPGQNRSKPVLKQITLFPIIPSVSWNYQF